MQSNRPSCAESEGDDGVQMKAGGRGLSTDWFGLTCECHLDGELVRGEVSDLAPTGFFVATTAAPEPGQELELRLVGGTTSQPIYLRGTFEASIRPQTRPGVRFRLLRFSKDYQHLIAGGSSNEHAGSSNEHAGKAPRQQRRSTKKTDEREWLAHVQGAGNAPPSTDSKQARERGDWEDYEPLPERAGVPLWSEDALAPEAIVIDDGELDDVVSLLGELGIKTERQSPEGNALPTNWIRPQHLLVVSAKRALKHRIPLRAETQSFVSIAVAEENSRTVYNAIRRIGYQYAISRPVHPLAMSMLFRQAAFSEHDQRTVQRGVLGCVVQWWRGWGRKQPGVILDVSPGGCQLLVRKAAATGSNIKIRVPSAVSNGNDFTLRGRVVRSIRGNGGTTLGVAFDSLPVKVHERLKQVLALPGPCLLTGEPLLREKATSPPEDSESPEVPQEERRRTFRAAIHQEVVALEHASSQILHVLVSRDMTVDGMRVEPHPSLAIGHQMDIALYEDSDDEPLILAAVVERDDGRLGWWLRFVGITPEVNQRLTQALDRFPPVASLDGPTPEPERVVLAQIRIEAKPASKIEHD